MGQVSLTGTLTAGPGAVTGAGQFPSAQATAQLGLRVEPSPFSAATGILQFSLDSAGAFVQLGGVDETIGPVKKCTLLYLRAPSAIQIRITRDDGLGGDLVTTEDHQGLFVKEWPDDKFVKLVEAKGVSLIEYFASGPG